MQNLHLHLFSISDLIFTIVGYSILLIALSFNAVQERKFMIKKVGKNAILILVTSIANGIYAISFIFRISLSIWLIVDHEGIVTLQCDCCKDLKVGFAILTFTKNFFGILLPLSAIFTL